MSLFLQELEAFHKRFPLETEKEICIEFERILKSEECILALKKGQYVYNHKENNPQYLVLKKMKSWALTKDKYHSSLNGRNGFQIV